MCESERTLPLDRYRRALTRGRMVGGRNIIQTLSHSCQSRSDWDCVGRGKVRTNIFVFLENLWPVTTQNEALHAAQSLSCESLIKPTFKGLKVAGGSDLLSTQLAE